MNANVIAGTCQHAIVRAEPGEEVPEIVLPAEASVDDGTARPGEQSVLGLVELILKNPTRVDSLINHAPNRQPILIPRFLAISLASYLLFSIALAIILNTAAAEAYPHRFLRVPIIGWANSSTVGVVAAYNLGLVGATSICLPSFYFFGLLAGLRLTMLQIVAQVLRAKATSALVLVGILPIYVAVVLGMVVFEAPASVQEYCLYVGLVLPFLAGLEGVRSIYRGALGMAQTLPPERRCRRECLLRRLTLSWAAVYTAVSPLMVYRLWEFFADHPA
jgi:hypothetical protein